jgi:hypothetical protein
MTKLFVFLAGLIVIVGGVYFALKSVSQGSVPAATSNDARELVVGFGSQLRNLSLLAQQEQLERDLENVYGPYVAPDLLAEWMNDPQKAPGRQTSSPWPERIDVSGVELIDGGFRVQGEIVEVTNEGGGIGEGPTVALRRPITLTVAQLVEGLRITSVTLGAYAGDGEWTYSEPNAQGVQFQYPRTLPTRYISAPAEGWPPQVVLEGGEYSCAEEQQRMIGDREYCVVETSEGAAGSTYRTYEYIAAQGDFLARVKFTLQFPQCGNYGEDEQPACETEQSTFDVDGLADRIASSIRML